MATLSDEPIDDGRWVPMHRHEVLMDVARRMLALHHAGTTTLSARTMERSADIFCDPDRGRREREALFRGRPLVAALSGQLPQRNDHLVLDVAGVSVLVVRSDDGVVRAFLNSCRHRGAPLAEGPGCSRHLTCRYHGWTYTNEGHLIGVPGSEGFSDMDHAARGLIALPCEERNGVVWLSVDPGGSLEIEPEVDGELAELQLERLVHLGSDTRTLRCNWHLALDTATESYHFLQLHWESIGDRTMANLNVLDHFGTMQRVGYAGSNLVDLDGTDSADWAPSECLQFVYLIFPNVALVVSSTYVVGLMQVFPGPTVEDCTMVLSSFSRDLTLLDGDPAEMHCGFWGVVAAEDLPVAEAIQRSMGATAFDSMLIGRNEAALQRLHQLYDELG